ncbi:hypothetical protein IQ260_15255 [Leptolyngbya cf. ectocarpi LEGE 11479]|uniref:Tricorn protease C1 domain-containing protein n=1 Tax=Leptolyngbya cf. ectocarpi LEGE 11479 TaxID=1828722 RepID=A0A928ZV24_LEPEC|nr:hypothetical protein [Leptolyngbya ectocarpi]MBE9068007.1 hypothetical protein [Leptolyngbya cf. ectocarpi LEGE 11479]
MVFRQEKIWLKGLLIIIVVSLSFGLLQRLTNPVASQPQPLFDAVWETVNDNFYDPDFNGVDWTALGEQYRPQVAASDDKATLINQMLSQLNTSHTHLYTPIDTMT